LINTPSLLSRRISVRLARSNSVSVNARAIRSMAVTILSGSQHFTQPREDAVAADELEHFEEPRAHGLAGHGDASGVNQQAGLHATFLGHGTER
jgi:hypothetical protein